MSGADPKIQGGSHLATKYDVSGNVSAGKRPCPLLPTLTPHAQNEKRLVRPFEAIPKVVATLRSPGTGYQAFPQVDGFTPHTTTIYSP